MIGTSHTLDKLLETAGRLYTLPAVALKVLQLTNRPDVDATALKHCIENDPALASKILRVVNSSLFGLSRPVCDLTQALALLGTKPLKLLVLGFSLPETLFVGLAGELLQKYWRRTLTKAVAARELSESVWGQPGDDAFLAGLFDDLGMLVLIQELQEPYVRFVKRLETEGGDLCELERRVLGFDHRQLSGRLLEQWGLPQQLIDGLAGARSPQSIDQMPPSERPLPQVLHLAHMLSTLLADEQREVLHELLEAGRRYHDLTAPELTSLVASLQDKVSQLAEVLSLELPDGMNYRDVLIQAHSHLSLVAAEAACELGRQAHQESFLCDGDIVLEEARWLQEAAESFATSAIHTAAPAVPQASSLSVAQKPAAVGTSSCPAPAKSVGVAPCSGAADLCGPVASAVASCRQSRRPLSLLLVEIDDFDGLSACGAAETARVVRFVNAACRTADHEPKLCIQESQSRFALLLSDCDRNAAVRLANNLVRSVQQFDTAGENDLPPVTVSAGIATLSLPPKNFPAKALIDAADRCLYGALSCGNSVKSIEIY